jgi:Phosphodiester glycosidase
MVKVPNVCMAKSQDIIVKQSNSRYVKSILWSIIGIALYLNAVGTVSAQQSPTVPNPNPVPRPQLPAPPLPGVISYGNQISLNGRILPGVWLQRRIKGDTFSTHLNDAAVRQLIGVDFLNSTNSTRQPVQWFSLPTKPLVLSSLLAGGYRYLDITNFVKTAGWQLQVSGNTLIISAPVAKVTNIRQGKAPSGELVTVDLDRATPWQIRQESSTKKVPAPPPDPDTPTPKVPTLPNREWTITLDGIADPVLLQRYAPEPPTLAPLPNLLKQLLPIPTQPAPPAGPIPPPEPLIQQVEVVNNQTLIRLSVPFGTAPRITTSSNPNRLLIEIRPDAMVERDIAWAPGVRWRQSFVNLNTERFPVVRLEVNPRTAGLKLAPIVSNIGTLIGTAPIIQTAQQYLAIAAINGGYFNRNNRYPLGAIRQNGQWLSSPILNRGAIAWNDSGQFYFGRLALEETLITANNQRSPILFLNSGYVQSGIARYTPSWGQTYIPLTDNEIILAIQKNQVINQLPAGKAGETTFPIPPDGYLLTLRGSAIKSTFQLPVGTSVRIESVTNPPEFGSYSHIIGAGPLLLQNRQIVLDAKSEKFSDAFIAEKAIRSGICTTSTGSLIIAAIHGRAGGPGPTLAEHAQLMQLLGCVNALNLDGGSSTGLYLGGQILDRSPNTAARVHNGIGIFLRP